jgi:lysophospholipase L1-like esterase
VNPIRVACIGDSITQYGGYPTYLQTNLGSGYDVKNFGLSASTVLFNTDIPYLYRNQMTRAKEFLPNIAIIMLGTNDARMDYYNSIYNFNADYKELINAIQELETNPEIFLVKPPPIFENGYNLQSSNLATGIIPRIEQVANELDLPLINVYAALKDYPEYFPDGVHPNSDGASIIAQEIYKAIILYAVNS